MREGAGMPKKIENVRALLLKEARRLLEKEGYGKLTMRSVASACGLGVGTAYNYFSSKDMLVASFMLEDWQTALQKMQSCQESGIKKVECVYQSLLEFIAQHQALFSDLNAQKSYSAGSAIWHKQLRDQLAAAVLPACSDQDGFLSQFIADSLLSWSAEGKDFSHLSPIIEKLL